MCQCLRRDRSCGLSPFYLINYFFVLGLYLSIYCLQFMLPAVIVASIISVPRVPLPVADTPGVPTNLRFPPLWELRDRGGGTHLQKLERAFHIVPFPELVAYVGLSFQLICPYEVQMFLEHSSIIYFIIYSGTYYLC